MGRVYQLRGVNLAEPDDLHHHCSQRADHL